MNYDTVNSFFADGKLIIFDVFCRLGELIVIMPKPLLYEISYFDVKIFCCDLILNPFETLDVSDSSTSQSIYIMKYHISSANDVLNIKIQYNEYQSDFLILNLKQIETRYELIQTTLFKNDFQLLPIYVKYYSHHK